MARKFGLMWLAFLTLALILARILLPDPDVTSLTLRNAMPGTVGHLMGTDLLGRDLLSQIAQQFVGLFGETILVAVSVAVSALVLTELAFRLSVRVAHAVSFGLTAAIAADLIYTGYVQLRLSYEAGTVWQAHLLLPLLALIFLLTVIYWLRGRAFTVEMPERDVWTGWGWRIARLSMSFFLIIPMMMHAQFALVAVFGNSTIWLFDFSVACIIVVLVFVLRSLTAQSNIDNARLLLRRSFASIFTWSLLGVFVQKAFRYLGATGHDLFNTSMMANENGANVAPAIVVATIMMLTVLSLLAVGGRRFSGSDRSNVFG